MELYNHLQCDEKKTLNLWEKKKDARPLDGNDSLHQLLAMISWFYRLSQNTKNGAIDIQKQERWKKKIPRNEATWREGCTTYFHRCKVET